MGGTWAASFELDAAVSAVTPAPTFPLAARPTLSIFLAGQGRASHSRR